MARARDLCTLQPAVRLADELVHVADRDRTGKLSYSGYDACYLGYDRNRLGHICYVPELRRISTYRVSKWRRASFEVCKTIHPDAPVTYEEVGMCRSSPVTSRPWPDNP